MEGKKFTNKCDKGVFFFTKRETVGENCNLPTVSDSCENEIQNCYLAQSLHKYYLSKSYQGHFYTQNVTTVKLRVTHDKIFVYDFCVL